MKGTGATTMWEVAQEGGCSMAMWGAVQEGACAAAMWGADPITDEQRNRIAKALHARKRPLDSTFSTPALSKCSNNKGSSPPAKTVCRVPLAAIQPGAPAVDVFSTPAKPLSSCGVNCSYVVSPVSILDEELDEDFLREVDAICEERSAVKTERPGVEGRVPDGNCTGKREGSGNFAVES